MKKKNYIYAVLCVIAILIVTVNCTDEALVKSTPQSQTDMRGFTLQEAKNFFEKKMIQGSANTRTGGKMSKTSLSPQDFTPKWDNAVGSAQKDLSSYDISIATNTRYQVTSYDFKGGVARISVVIASQKLVIVKDPETESLGQYILTLIPTKDCYAKHKKNICDLFINCSDKSRFSGVAIYTNPLNGRIIRANRFVDGQSVQGVFMPGDLQTLGQRVKILRSVLEGLIFRRLAVATTRFGESDYGEDSYPSIPPLPDNDNWDYKLGNYTDLGGGYFWDENNHKILYDSDGDGEADSGWIPQVNVTPDNSGNTGETGETGGIDQPDETEGTLIPEPPTEPETSTDPEIPTDPFPGDDNYCPLCGSIGCNGGCAGELTQPDSPTIVPIEPVKPETTDMIVKKLFRNSNMTEDNWKTLEKLIKKIMNNCMGEALVNGLLNKLNGKMLTIQFVNKGYSAFSFNSNKNTAGIELDISAESNQLFHEMWHAYQAFFETPSSFFNASINVEIEAHYAQYQYLVSLPEYRGSKWEVGYLKNQRLRSIAHLNDYVDNRGSLLPNVTETMLSERVKTAVGAFKYDEAYENDSYDDKRSAISIFSNLRELTKKCLK